LEVTCIAAEPGDIAKMESNRKIKPNSPQGRNCIASTDERLFPRFSCGPLAWFCFWRPFSCSWHFVQRNYRKSMSDLLNRLGYLQTRRDRTPNLDLARDLVARNDIAGIREIAENMWNDNKNIHGDCINVMYEIAIIDPNLVIPYAEDFIKFIKSKHQNMVRGAITALAEIAKIKPDFIFKHLNEIKKVKESSSDITLDKSISALANTSAGDKEYSKVIFPYLLEHLSTCYFKEIPEHAERILPAVNEDNQFEYIKTLEKRIEQLSGSDFTRLKKIIRIAEKI
jgi:hypothetical protein